MEVLENVQLISQSHALSVASPFNIVCDYGKGPWKKLRGDVHYALQITMVLHGEAEAIVGNHLRSYKEGELWFTMCWEPHAYRLLARRNLMVSINLTVDSLGNCGPYADADFLAPFTVSPEERYVPETEEQHEEILAYARKLLRLSRKRTPNWQTHCWLAIHELILSASEHVSGKKMEFSCPNPNINRIMKAVTLIRTLPVPLSLEDCAKSCSLSVSRFSYLFRSVMGVSYGQFALRVRLANAANDIKAGLYTLNEVAFRHRFCDASSLCNAFKKVYRCTPNEFKYRHN